jgi:hypothetical protein
MLGMEPRASHMLYNWANPQSLVVCLLPCGSMFQTIISLAHCLSRSMICVQWVFVGYLFFNWLVILWFIQYLLNISCGPGQRTWSHLCLPELEGHGYKQPGGLDKTWVGEGQLVLSTGGACRGSQGNHRRTVNVACGFRGSFLERWCSLNESQRRLVGKI